MKAGGALLGAFILIFSIHFASAAFTVDLNSTSIRQSYNVGDQVTGNIAISFENESLDSVITVNLGSKKATLEEWIKRSGRREGIDYNCSFAGCTPRYQSRGAITDIIIQSAYPKLFGFKTSGSNITIEDISFAVKSSLSNSCTKPFSIDPFDLGKYVLEGYQYSDNFCQGYRQGCFDYTLGESQYQIANITNSPYCEKIKLSPGPAYLLGADLTSSNNAPEEKIIMQLYDSSFTTYYGNCSFSSLQNQSSCVIPYPISQEKEYFVCVLSNQTNSAFRIKTEFSGSICGTANSGQSLSRDFDIYARGLEYSTEPSTFNEDTFALLNAEENLSDIANDYLGTEYNSNCITQDCFMPFKIVGSVQQIYFSNVSLTYKSDGVPVSDNNVYAIEKRASTIRSGRIVLSLADLNLNISQIGTLLQLNIENRTLFRTNVSVTAAPIAIVPTFALIGVPSTFSIKSNETIASASWKFSNEAAARPGLTASQTFSQAGTYNVDVTATTSTGKTYTKNQQIVVGEPKASAEELYQLSEQAISSFAGDINTLPPWIASDIRNKINIVTLNNSLLAIREKMRYALNSTDYMNVIEQIRELNIPRDLSVSRTGTFPVIAGYGHINLEYANSLYQTKNAQELSPAVLEWTRENYNTQIETTSYSKTTVNGDVQHVLTKVKITAAPLKDQASTQYLIIDYPLEALHFMEAYSQKELQGGTYIPLDSAKTIEFYIEEDATIETLGIYILPSLNELQDASPTYEIVSSAEESRKSVIYVSLAILLAAFIIAVIALQYWYRHNYERYLYPGEESLFNVMTFIYNAKKKGLKEGDMRKSLVSSGWSREQINYALGRFEGKILGLFGIPIYSAREEQKVRDRIESKNKQNTGRKVY